jgi:hypothetical protein
MHAVCMWHVQFIMNVFYVTYHGVLIHANDNEGVYNSVHVCLI